MTRHLLLILMLTLVTRSAQAAPSESPPTLIAHWRTANDRNPSDFAFLAPNRLYLVDQSQSGVSWTLEQAQPIVFSTVNPISNDRSDLWDVAVAPDGQVFAVDIPPSGFPSRLWRFAASGARIGSSALGPTAPVFGNAIAMLDAETLLLGLSNGATGSFLRLDLVGNVLGPWGPTLPMGLAESGIDIAVAPSGEVFVMDGAAFRVLKFDHEGTLMGSWGRRGTGEGEFDVIGGIAVDEFGNVYVADYGNNRVQKFTQDGQFLLQWGGPCSQGPCAPLSLNEPRAVVCLPGNRVAVGSRTFTAQNVPITEVRIFQMSSAPTSVTPASWGAVKRRYR